MQHQVKFLSLYSEFMYSSWPFGRYLEHLLHERGWKKVDLQRRAGLTSGYITYLVNGETSGKANPPNITMETLIKLSKALSVHPAKLMSAYMGKDPDEMDKDPTYTESESWTVLSEHSKESIYKMIEFFAEQERGKE